MGGCHGLEVGRNEGREEGLGVGCVAPSGPCSALSTSSWTSSREAAIEAMGVPELKLRKRLFREQSWSW